MSRNCLRLTYVVTSISSKLDPQGGGSTYAISRLPALGEDLHLRLKHAYLSALYFMSFLTLYHLL